MGIKRIAIYVLIVLCGSLTALKAEEKWDIFTQENIPMVYPTGTAVSEEINGHLWLMDKCGLTVYESASVEINTDNAIATYDYNDCGAPSQWLWPHGMVENNDGVKYFALESGLLTHNGSDWNFISPDTTAEMGYCNMDIEKDGDGTIWIANQDGVLTIDNDGNRTLYNASNTPMVAEYPQINDICISDDNKKWMLGMDGLISYDGNEWKICTDDPNIANQYGMCLKDTLIYVASNNGLFTYNTKTEEINDITSALDYTTTNTCAVNPVTGDLWVSQDSDWFTFGALFKYDGSIWTKYSTDEIGLNGQSLPSINEISFDSKGNTWFGVGELGFLRYSNNVVNNISDESNVIATTAELFQNYPNPFNPETSISFNMRQAAQVKLTVYDINGQAVSILANGRLGTGAHLVNFKAANISSGTYYYTLQVGGQSMTKKMMYIK